MKKNKKSIKRIVALIAIPIVAVVAWYSAVKVDWQTILAGLRGESVSSITKELDSTSNDYTAVYDAYVTLSAETTSQITQLTEQMKQLASQKDIAEQQVIALQEQVAGQNENIEILTNLNNANESLVENLNSRVEELLSQIDVLAASEKDKASQIEQLTAQKNSAELQVVALQKQNAELTDNALILTGLVAENNSLIENLNMQVLSLIELMTTGEIAELIAAKANAEQQIVELQKQNDGLNETVASLTEIINQNDILISNLNTQAEDLQCQVEILTSSDNDKASQIEQLTNQVNTAEQQAANLQNKVDELDRTIEALDILKDANAVLIEDLNLQISDYQNQVEMLIESDGNKATEIEQLLIQINSAEQQAISLQNQNSELNNTISELTNFRYEDALLIENLYSQVAGLQNQVEILTLSDSQKAKQIEELNAEIGNYQTVISQLETTNVTNLGLINSLNEQLTQATNTIDALTAHIEQQNITINTLNQSISELENSVAIYQQTINVLKTAVSFSADSWDTINQIAQLGLAKHFYCIGDEKTTSLSTNEQVTFIILGFNHDDLTAGGKAAIAIGMKDLLATSYRMNSSNTNVGGWESSEMRTNTLPKILGMLPNDLQTVIKQVNKKTTAGDSSTNIVTSTNKLFLFSEVEVSATTTEGYANEGSQYEYWRTIKNGTTAADRIKRVSNGTGSTKSWWLRSPYNTNSATFRSFTTSGDNGMSLNVASGTNGVCFGFCV